MLQFGAGLITRIAQPIGTIEDDEQHREDEPGQEVGAFCLGGKQVSQRREEILVSWRSNRATVSRRRGKGTNISFSS
jgi:hypothetical protein